MLYLHSSSSLLILAATAAAQLTVTGVTPARNSRGADPAARVTLTFSAPVNPATITNQSIKLIGRWSGPVPGQLSIGPGATTVTLAPLRPLFASEIALLTITNTVASAGGQALTGGFFAAARTSSAACRAATGSRCCSATVLASSR